MPNIFQHAYRSISNRFTTIKYKTVYDHNVYLQNKKLNLGKFDKNRAELNSTVFTCVSIIANSISKFPLHIMKYENGKKVKYTNHPWYNALRYTPFQSVNSQKFYSNGLTNMYLSGNKFYYKQEYDSNFNLNPQLIPLCEPKAISDMEGETWYKFDNSSSWLPAKDLVHFYVLSKDGKLGLNPIDSIVAEWQYKKWVKKD